MKISVIIPTYNRRNNVLKTLKCLQWQRTEGFDWEVIVVDDCSEDGTSQEILKYHWDFNLKLVRKNYHEGWNASVPRNIGARISDIKSDLLYFLDSDVLLPPNRIQQLYLDYSHDTDPNRVIIGPYHYIQQSKWENPDDLPTDWSEHPVEGWSQDIRWEMFGQYPVEEKLNGLNAALACFGGSLLIPRKLFFKAGGYDEHCVAGTEDGDFGLTLWETGARFSVDKALLGFHHPHVILPSRTERIGEMVNYIDTKHSMDLIKETGKAMRSWGHENWIIPDEWLEGSGYTREEINEA